MKWWQTGSTFRTQDDRQDWGFYQLCSHASSLSGVAVLQPWALALGAEGQQWPHFWLLVGEDWMGLANSVPCSLLDPTGLGSFLPLTSPAQLTPSFIGHKENLCMFRFCADSLSPFILSPCDSKVPLMPNMAVCIPSHPFLDKFCPISMEVYLGCQGEPCSLVIYSPIFEAHHH